MGRFVEYFQSGGLVPQGAGLIWRTDLIALNVIADAVLALACVAAGVIAWQISRWRDGFGQAATARLFVAAAAGCAVLHAAAIAVIWIPAYAPQGWLKLACALAAAAAAVAAWRAVPTILAMHGPDEWQAQARTLEVEVRRRSAAETEVRNAHDALDAADRDLEARVAMRTADLAAANEELQRFAYIASHELRAPLRALMTIPDWLRDTLTDTYGEVAEPLEQDLSELQRQSGRMDRLLTDLLTYARIGQSGDPVTPLDPEPLIAESVSLAGVPQEFDVSVTGPFPPVGAIDTEFKLVMRNLVSNAVKHHDGKAGRIAISSRSAAGSTVIEVRDDGPGIDAKFADKVFEMFSTLRPRDEVEGSGMGLAMVRKSMERVGGQVRLGEGHEGRGAAFELHFPPLAAGDCIKGGTECSRSFSRKTAISLSATSPASSHSGMNPMR